MELDEAIKHCKEKAKELRKEKHIMAVTGREQEWADCLQCAEEHEQLAEWLTDYKRLKALEEQERHKCLTCKHYKDKIFNNYCRECSRAWADLYEEDRGNESN